MSASAEHLVVTIIPSVRDIIDGHSYALYYTPFPRVPELIPVLGSQPAGDRSHKPSDRLPLLSGAAGPAVTSPAAEHITAHWLVPNYTAWRQRHIVCVNNLPEVALGSAAAGIRTRDLLIARYLFLY